MTMKFVYNQNDIKIIAEKCLDDVKFIYLQIFSYSMSLDKVYQRIIEEIFYSGSQQT